MSYIFEKISLRKLTSQILIATIFLCTFVNFAAAQKSSLGSNRLIAADTEQAPATCASGTFTLTGNSGLDGADGNIRVFTAGGVNVRASAFSRRVSDGAWQTAFLGAFSPGLGVTDRGEGDGTTNDNHKVDNIGDRKNYVLFEFDGPVVVDRVFLDSVTNDSDITVWIGTAADPYNNHLTLSDALLSAFAPNEENSAADGASRWADINAGLKAGNVLVVAASVNDSTPEDAFKIKNIEFDCAQVTPPCQAGELKTEGNSSEDGPDGNSRNFNVGNVSFNARAFSRTKVGGIWETAFLGAFASGLGVTDRGESGTGDTHKVDNNGDRLNYVIFEFNKAVIVDQIYLDAVTNGSDISIWIGNAADPFNNPLTLSDAVLTGLGSEEINNGTSARYADVNSAQKAGNVLVVAAKTTDTQDWFKIGALDLKCPTSAKVTIIKQVLLPNGGTASAQSFPFTATNLGAAGFNLVDNNSVGPDRFSNLNITAFGAANTISVTESLVSGWTLSDLSCTESGGINNTTTNFGGRTANIIVEPGETVVCTYTNTSLIPTAASVYVSGRATTAEGIGIKDAVLSLVDLGSGQVRQTRTNSFGNYTFQGIEVGRFYTLTIEHRRYFFTENTRTFTLSDELAGMDFVQAF